MTTMRPNEHWTSHRLRTCLVAAMGMAVALGAHAAQLPVASYIYESGNLTIFPDTGGTQLTDGIFAPSSNFNHAEFVGVQDDAPDDGVGQPAVLFNLGSVNLVDSVLISYLHSSSQAGGTITAPESAEISLSLDGINFSSPVVFTAEFDSSAGDAVRQASLNFTDTMAQYVRVDIRNSLGGNPAGQWVFLDEVQIHGAVPEPETCGLAAGALAVAFAVWRQQTRNRLA